MLKASEYSSEGSPLISVGEIREGYFTIHDHTPRVCAKIKAKLPQFILEEGDIVFGRKGAINRNAIVMNPQAGWFLGSDGIRLRLTDKHDPAFFSYFLRTKMIGDWLLSNGQGAIMPSLNQRILDRLPLFLPSKAEQRRISSALTALDAKIELNNRINAELEGMAKLLYGYWFVQFDFPMTTAQAAALGKPHLTGHPYRASGGKMIFCPELKRNIPEAWKVGDLSELCSTVRGVTYSKADVRSSTDESTIPILRATNVNNGVVDLSDLVFVTDDMPSEDQFLDKFDILIVMSSGSKAHVGKNALYCHDRKVAYGAFCSKIVPREACRFFVSVHLQTDAFKKFISNVCLGTNINNLTNGHITGHRLVIPPQDQLLGFENMVASFFEKIACNHQQNQELTQLRDWLLPMLMNGQVTVGTNER
jgi:type I restriction enzyme S subunit